MCMVNEGYLIKPVFIKGVFDKFIPAVSVETPNSKNRCIFTEHILSSYSIDYDSDFNHTSENVYYFSKCVGLENHNKKDIYNQINKTILPEYASHIIIDKIHMHMQVPHKYDDVLVIPKDEMHDLSGLPNALYYIINADTTTFLTAFPEYSKLLKKKINLWNHHGAKKYSDIYMNVYRCLKTNVKFITSRQIEDEVIHKQGIDIDYNTYSNLRDMFLGSSEDYLVALKILTSCNYKSSMLYIDLLNMETRFLANPKEIDPDIINPILTRFKDLVQPILKLSYSYLYNRAYMALLYCKFYKEYKEQIDLINELKEYISTKYNTHIVEGCKSMMNVSIDSSLPQPKIKSKLSFLNPINEIEYEFEL